MRCSEPSEFLTFQDTFSPSLHHINQAIRNRAVQKDGLDPPADILLKWSKPSEDLVSSVTPQLEKLITAADVKKGTYIVDSFTR
jgi:ATP-dependent DNA helicase 2 subunit 2